MVLCQANENEATPQTPEIAEVVKEWGTEIHRFKSK
jgi:hypothetical protein